MANGDLFTAIRGFNQEMDRLALQRTFNTANEQVQAIRASEASEAEQRQQLRQLSEQIALQLGGQGVSAAGIQSAQQAISPQDPREMLLFKHALDLEKERLKQASKPGRPLGPSSVKRLSQFDEHRTVVNQLLAAVDEDPNLVGLIHRTPGAVFVRKIGDPKFAAFHDKIEQFFQAYRQRITGAQASVRELAILRKIIPQAGDTNEVFKARLEGNLAELDALQNSVLDSLEKSNFDIGKWRVGNPGERSPKGIDTKPKKIPGLKF